MSKTSQKGPFSQHNRGPFLRVSKEKEKSEEKVGDVPFLAAKKISVRVWQEILALLAVRVAALLSQAWSDYDEHTKKHHKE